MKEKLYEFRFIILIVVIGLTLSGVVKFVVKSTNNENLNARSELASINNKISTINTQKQDELHVTKPYPLQGGVSIDGKTAGLDRNRWKTDTETFNAWVSNAFNYTNSLEYAEHRAEYIEKLGETNDFLVYIMEPYEAKYGYLSSETQRVDDGTHISMQLKSMKSYVKGIYDLDNDGTYETYNYITIITVDSTNYAIGSNGAPYQVQKNDRFFVLTYMMDDKGEITGFRAVPQHEAMYR